MQCTDFFVPYLDWLRGNPPPPPTQENLVHFLMTSNRDESNHFVFFGDGVFRLQTNFLLFADRCNVLFSDRVNPNAGGATLTGAQLFDANQPEENQIRLSVPAGPLERRDPSG